MMRSNIFDIEAIERKDYSSKGNVISLNQPVIAENSDAQGDLQVFDFVPEEPSRPWSLDDETDSKIINAVSRWGDRALRGSSGSSAEDERGRAVAVSVVAGPLMILGLIAANELIK